MCYFCLLTSLTGEHQYSLFLKMEEKINLANYSIPLQLQKQRSWHLKEKVFGLKM